MPPGRILVAISYMLVACSSPSPGGGQPAAGGASGAGGTSGTSGLDAGPPPASQIGTGDGSPGSVALTVVYEPAAPRSATDLAFHPTRDELWVLLREHYEGAPCTSTQKSGCSSLAGSVAIVRGAGGPSPTWEWKKDPNALHFMRRPPALAFGDADTFATCGEARTGNLEDDPIDYIGPTLWSSDPAVFAKQPPGQNGSHLDMLHATPFCMGIAHEQSNAYWTFNGNVGALDRYDFNEPHEIGGADHSNGEIYRYVEGQVKRLPGVPSHMVFDSSDSALYVADTGNQRIVKLDTQSGVPLSTPLPVYEPVAVHQSVDFATLVEVVLPGTLEAPSGLHLAAGILFVTDNATSKIHAFERDGTPIRELDTGLPVGTLAGFTLGPDGKAYFVDLLTSRAYRIDP